MTNEIENQLAAILTDVAGAAGEAKDFLVAEIPDVAQQVLLWYGTYNFLQFIFSILIWVSIIFYWKWLNKATLKSSDVEEFFTVAGGIGSLFFITLSVFLINLTWLKIWIAPKLFLIEYAGTLVKG